MITFTQLNKEANYYTQISKKTGENHWAQDKFQSSFIKLVEHCDLSKKQVDSLGEMMVANNERLDMQPSNNKSVAEFETFAKNKTATVEKGRGMNMAA